MQIQVWKIQKITPIIVNIHCNKNGLRIKRDMIRIGIERWFEFVNYLMRATILPIFRWEMLLEFSWCWISRECGSLIESKTCNISFIWISMRYRKCNNIYLKFAERNTNFRGVFFLLSYYYFSMQQTPQRCLSVTLWTRIAPVWKAGSQSSIDVRPCSISSRRDHSAGKGLRTSYAQFLVSSSSIALARTVVGGYCARVFLARLPRNNCVLQPEGSDRFARRFERPLRTADWDEQGDAPYKFGYPSTVPWW